MKRLQLQSGDIPKALEIIKETADRRLTEKGRGVIVSDHEALGVVAEEYHEFVGAVTSGTGDDVYNELLDIAVACVVAMASMDRIYKARQ